MSFEASREIPRYPEIDSFANWLTCRPAKWQETRASTLPRNQPLSPRSFYALFRTYSPNFMGGKSDLGQKGWAGLESIITNTREEEKVPAERALANVLPPRRQKQKPLQADISSRTPPITLLRLAVKLICPDCVSAPTNAGASRAPCKHHARYLNQNVLSFRFKPDLWGVSLAGILLTSRHDTPGSPARVALKLLLWGLTCRSRSLHW